MTSLFTNTKSGHNFNRTKVGYVQKPQVCNDEVSRPAMKQLSGLGKQT